MKEHSVAVGSCTMHHPNSCTNRQIFTTWWEAFWSLHHAYIHHHSRFGPGLEVHPIFGNRLPCRGLPTIAFFIRGPRTGRLTLWNEDRSPCRYARDMGTQPSV